MQRLAAIGLKRRKNIWLCMKIVAARISVGSAAALIIFTCVFSASSFWAGLTTPTPWRFLFLAFAPCPLAVAAVIFYRAVIFKGAIWTENAKLHMGWRQQVLVNDIRSIAIEDVDIPLAYMPMRGRYIIVRLRNGRTLYSAPVQNFTEDESVILARLRAACGLPEDPNAGTPLQA